MKKTVLLKELRANVGEYADRVQKGETFIITKRSESLFKIAPVGEGQWTAVVDFTKIRKGGIEIGELLSRLRPYDR